MESELKHFLIVFDAGKGALVRVQEFSAADKAVEEYGREEETFRDRTEMQVVGFSPFVRSANVDLWQPSARRLPPEQRRRSGP